MTTFDIPEERGQEPSWGIERVRFFPEVSELSQVERNNPFVGTPVFRIRKPGLLTTIQDLGRTQYQLQGVPCCGAMDPYAFRLGNLLVGNPENTASLEMTITGPEMEVLLDCQVAITGPSLSPKSREVSIGLWQNHQLQAGQVLSFDPGVTGARSYLSIRGGFAARHMLGSASTDLNSRFGGYFGRSLQKGDLLSFQAAGQLGDSRIPQRWVRTDCLEQYNDSFSLRVIPGPQDDCFPPCEREKLYSNEFRLNPKSNRMGYLLEGPAILAEKTEIISDPVPLGGLQALPSGQLVLLMADHQSVGGYPKIAVVISADIPKAAQLRIGDRVRFLPVRLEVAHQLLKLQESCISNGVQT